jgi:hypothetical protein
VQAGLVAEEHRGELETEREDDYRRDQAAIERVQPARRERDEDADEAGDPQVLDRLADREAAEIGGGLRRLCRGAFQSWISKGTTVMFEATP